MKKTRYPIKKEFFPYTLFTPPMSPKIVALSQKTMKAPASLWKDPELHVRFYRIPGFREGEIELLLIAPSGLKTPAPCLLNIHGGGFVFEATSSHYAHAASYAKRAGCAVAFPRYRLGPAYPFPYPQEDSYAAFVWIAEHAEELGIDPARIGVGGDSAGGTLSVVTCMMARDRNFACRPRFQLLIYPFLDDRKTSGSYNRFTDTPMWNSSLSKKVGSMINPNPAETPLAYRSPVEADRFDSLPPAYIEVAEFDALHDDGICYAELLRNEGIAVELHETEGTMHGFDSKVTAPTTRAMVGQRIAFLRRMFGETEKA